MTTQIQSMANPCSVQVRSKTGPESVDEEEEVEKEEEEEEEEEELLASLAERSLFRCTVFLAQATEALARACYQEVSAPLSI
jgi:hypothetical protein